MSIEVLAPGLLTSVQDAGRRGHTALGVGHAGAMDPVALRLANILVDNVDNAATLEMTLRGPRLRFDHDTLIAITGAPIEAQCGGEPLPLWCPLAIRAGSELVLGGMHHGSRSYLAVGGGLGIDPVLGSRSSDLNAGLGANPLATADTFATTAANREIARALWHELDVNTRAFAAPKWALDPQPWFDAHPQQPIRIIAGTQFSHLDEASQRALFATDFRIGAESNRVGYRLTGATLQLRAPLELVSAGVVPGTVQLPAGGDPIVLMAEAPTCGGYPRIAQVISVDLPRLAQRRPGDLLRFAETSLDDAQTRYLEREQALVRIGLSVFARLRACTALFCDSPQP